MNIATKKIRAILNVKMPKSLGVNIKEAYKRFIKKFVTLENAADKVTGIYLLKVINK